MTAPSSTQPSTLEDNADYQSSLEFKSPPSRVFEAITSAEALSGWWGPASGHGLKGGELRFAFMKDPLVLRVDEAEPTTVQWTTVTSFEPFMDWLGTVITFNIRPTESGGSTLHFRHHGLTPQLECFTTCKAGWDEHLPSLVHYVDAQHGSLVGSASAP